MTAPSLEQVQENEKIFSDDCVLTDTETETLMCACEAFRIQVQVPCTDCRYCCDGCPAHINIPVILKLYNRYKIDGSWVLRDKDEIDSQGKPVNCVECGDCSAHCPQGIDIKAIMHEMSML